MDKLILEADETGKRLDAYLAENTELTRTRIQQLIKEENIKVNDKKTKSSYKIEMGDTIKVFIPEKKEIDLVPQNISINIFLSAGNNILSSWGSFVSGVLEEVIPLIFFKLLSLAAVF